MKNSRYFKTTDSAVIAALQKHHDDGDALLTRSKAFALKFGGEQSSAIYQNGILGVRILGVKFDPAKPTNSWTQPNYKTNSIQRPRKTITGATDQEKAEHAALYQDWKNSFPAETVPYLPVLQAMGIKEMDILFGGGFGQFEHEGVIYVTTGAAVGEALTEILASEYIAAKEAHDAAKKTA